MKILLLDIETAPMVADVWQMFDVNVGLNQIVQDWYVLSWAAKWLDKPRVYYADQRGQADITDDSGTLAGMWKLLDEADIVVAHNGDKFDVKKLNARFIKAGFPPPSPYRTIDTLKTAKAKFKFTSNRLAYLAMYLGVEEKSEHHDFPGHSLWTEVRKGNMKAWREMKRYNVQDVHTLEQVYLKLRAWDAPRPSIALQDGTQRCPVCGGEHLVASGMHITNTGLFQRYQCEECSAWSRDKTNLLTKEQRKALVAR